MTNVKNTTTFSDGEDDDSPESAPPLPQLVRLSDFDLLSQWRKEAEDAYAARNDNQLRGPITGLTSLDINLGGRLPPGIIALHGGSGAGKSALASQVATDCGFPALLVTCELSVLEVTRRIVARTTETFLNRIRSGELTPDAMLELLQDTVAVAPSVGIVDATLAYADPDYILDAAIAVRGDSKHVLIVVDSLHSWTEGAGVDASEYELLNGGLRELRQVALKLACPLLLVVERNRVSMKKGGLSAGAGSRKIEYGAEVVLSLQVDDDAYEDAQGDKPVVLKVEKNRNGSGGRQFMLQFNGALQRFSEANE